MKNDSRDNIIDKIRKAKPESRILPSIPVFDVPGKPLQNFVSHLKGFDGDYRLFGTRDEAVEWLQNNIVSGSKKVFSSVKGMNGCLGLDDFKDEAAMSEVDVCVAEALMAVGETGSLLVDVRSLGSPAAALFSTDLYLLIDRKTMVGGMQEAYTKIDLADSQYSSFFTGPSATADIEAVHITGAQGEISLTAVMYNCDDKDIKDVNEIMKHLPQGTPLGQPDAPHLALERETDLDKGQDSV